MPLFPLNVGGSGTVSSVALSAPSSILTVSGSPVTTTGTLTLALAVQSANKVWAGPSMGAASTPVFRSLVASDTSYVNLTLTHEAQVYAVGDSMTQAGVWETQVNTLLGSSWNLNNRGINGNTTAQMVNRFTADVVSQTNAEYVVILGGINDINTGAVASAIQANLQAMYSAAHSAGIKVIAVTILPFKGYVTWSLATQAILDSVNSWIKNTATDVDYIIDGYTTLLDPAVPYTLLPSYDSGDHLHPSTSGYNVLGSAIFSGSTWIARSTLPIVHSSPTNVYLDQNLRQFDSPLFNALSLGRLPDSQRSLTVRTRTTTTDEQQVLLQQYNSNSDGWGLWADVSGNLSFQRYTAASFLSSALTINAAGTVNLPNYSAGVVFIGSSGLITSVTAPVFTGLVTVRQPGGSSLNFDSNASSTYNVFGSYANSGTEFADFYFSHGNAIFQPQGVEALRITNARNLLVGTTSESGLSGGGNISIIGAILTGAPTSGSAAVWKLGSKVTTSGLTMSTVGYVQLDVAGTLYKLALCN